MDNHLRVEENRDDSGFGIFTASKKRTLVASPGQQQRRPLSHLVLLLDELESRVDEMLLGQNVVLQIDEVV